MSYFKQQLAMFKESRGCIKEVDADVIDLDDVDFERQARLFCTHIIERLPEGTYKEFARITGMDPDKVMEAGIKIYHDREEENENYQLKRKT